MLWEGQSVNNQLTGYSPPVNNTLIYANTNNLLHFGVVIPVRDHSLLMVVSSLAAMSTFPRREESRFGEEKVHK